MRKILLRKILRPTLNKTNTGPGAQPSGVFVHDLSRTPQRTMMSTTAFVDLAWFEFPL